MRRAPPTGVLLINVGTPDAPHPSEVRRYLKEFLSDPRVMDIPGWARWLLLHLFILPLRSRRSARAYQAIWTPDGSPLLVQSHGLAAAVGAALGGDFVVRVGMRYGQPSIGRGLYELAQHDVRRIIVLPLFPQYASAATGTAVQKVWDEAGRWWDVPPIDVRGAFYEHPDFIGALADRLRATQATFQPDMILFSYHGLPERHVARSDHPDTACDRQEACPAMEPSNRYCYRAQCYATSRLLAAAAGLGETDYAVAFQSRLGRTPWIKPYSDMLLPELRQRGVKRLAVACPSFVADCLETLEEVGIRMRESWRELGGDDLVLIPCVNDHPRWVQAVVAIIRDAPHTPPLEQGTLSTTPP